jgi:hypothetical protein
MAIVHYYYYRGLLMKTRITINQNINDFHIDTFYFMDKRAILGNRSEPLYRAISWIEDDNEAHY